MLTMLKETTYNRLTERIVEEAAARADLKNHEKKGNGSPHDLEAEDNNNNAAITITAEDLELINEFLDV